MTKRCRWINCHERLRMD